ncbi:IclR family transcriptional regulator [Neorhizobium galegae]|uniref:IclR family transcriptional regulator n=1 Tax=Neorhizobium galegae TaxID=399 RepID=UPI0006215E03|nr:IclR family transcriptional regulator [Neorhizobium galegae]CDZ26610.1 Transcriptional regulator KdgR [Neorhizobium galegae bv. officinalis]KAA9383581.1 IclR family transcriptional regulator [Neorhizobium galegae]KAB1111712.1 IclR family transcriptional regulator [Neorhizobium galegae]MCM2500782.1 IclR family transcriptional regulator [Neorhizobium galegae]MCQ1768395.1 IclR family transcriptional regulator [Neorhizobium galegae]
MDTVYSNRIQEEGGGVRPLSTVLKTMAVLDVLASSARGMKLPEIALAMELSRPTAYQRLLTLIEAGWVEQDQEMRYRLSMHACRLAAAAMEQANLGTRIQPIIEMLVHRVKETASLAVLDRGLPCIVSRVESESVLRAEQKIGTTMSLEGSASGRVLTAFADEVTLARLKESGEPLASEELLVEARANGYALSSGYTDSGVVAIAAPIFDLHGKCTSTISLVMPEMRFDLESFREPLLETARTITKMQQGER